jgi:hypothetical protein
MPLPFFEWGSPLSRNGDCGEEFRNEAERILHCIWATGNNGWTLLAEERVAEKRTILLNQNMFLRIISLDIIVEHHVTPLLKKGEMFLPFSRCLAYMHCLFICLNYFLLLSLASLFVVCFGCLISLLMAN